MKQSIAKSIKFGFGNVKITRNPKAKYLRLKVHPEKGVSVTLPSSYSENQAIDFILKKEDWIIKSLAKTNLKKEKLSLFSEETSFNTRFHKLVIKKHNKPTLMSAKINDKLVVYYPESTDIESENTQLFIRKSIVDTLKKEAALYLPDRTRMFAKQHQLKVGNITVRNNKTRWGSCSGKNNISLNIHLMRLPDAFADYVILHELAHIKHKNHSPQFWSYLEQICKQARFLDKKLNTFHLVYW